jgi:arabinofuranosyltransferase
MRLRKLLQPEILIPALAIAARLLPGPRTIDDAYITFRYARNLLEGLGLVYNPGEAVFGSTTPLYALLMAGLGLASGGPHAPFPALAWIANALADGISCWLLIRLAGSFGERRAGIVTAAVWAIAPMSVTFAIGGMETSVFIALMLGTLYLYSVERPVAAALCGGLSLLARPDAILFLGPLALERLRRSLPSTKLNPQPLRISLKETLAFGLPVAAWAAFAVIVYGSPVPQSILAKAAAYHLPPEAGVIRLIQHYATPFQEHLVFGPRWIAVGIFLYPVLFGLGALMVLRRRPSTWPVFLYPWVYMIVYSAANPLIFRWYLTPPLPTYFLGIFLGAERLGRDIKRPNLVVTLVTAAALILTLRGWTLRPDHGPTRPAPEMAYIQLELLYEGVANDLRDRMTPGQVLAAGDVGALGYFTDARILDTVGLVTPVSSAYYPLPESQYIINYAMPTALIMDTRPDWLVLLEVYGRNTLLQDPTFLQSYRLEQEIPTDIYGSHAMLVFSRIGVP